MKSSESSRKKPSILGILVTFDISVILVIFSLLLIFFNTTIATLLFDTAAGSMIARSERIHQSLNDAYAYIANKPEIDSEATYDKLHGNILSHAINELEYDQSLAVMLVEDSVMLCGTRLKRNIEPESLELVEFAEENQENILLEISDLKDFLKTKDGNIALMRFKSSGRSYIGSVQLISKSGNEFIFILSDQVQDFFSQLYIIRNIFLIFVGAVLIMVLVLKIINTRSATNEISKIRMQLQEQGDIIQRYGLVSNTNSPEKFQFLDTNDLAGSYYYLNGRIESLGNIIEGIADQDLFKAALRDDESVLKPHEENMAILFLDVQGFTGISEQYESDAMRIINIIWDGVQAAVEDNGGKLNKFMGDACLAIFPESSDEQSPSMRALMSSIALLRSVSDLRKKTSTDFSFRIGLDYGAVVYGKTGSEKKYELGVIGDPVNTAARFESLNKQYGTKLLISGEILENAGIDLGIATESGENKITHQFFEEGLFIFKTDEARPKGKKNSKSMYTFLDRDLYNNSLFTILGTGKVFRYEVFKLHSKFVNAYSAKLALWSNNDTVQAVKVWESLAYNWAVMHYQYKFTIAEMFIERFVTPESFLAYKRSPREWIASRAMEVVPPNEEWLKTGYYELSK